MLHFVANVRKRLNMSHATIGGSHCCCWIFSFASFCNDCTHSVWNVISLLFSYSCKNFNNSIKSTAYPMWHKRKSLLNWYKLNGRKIRCLFTCTITWFFITLPSEHNRQLSWKTMNSIQFKSMEITTWANDSNQHWNSS